MAVIRVSIRTIPEGQHRTLLTATVYSLLWLIASREQGDLWSPPKCMGGVGGWWRRGRAGNLSEPICVVSGASYQLASALSTVYTVTFVPAPHNTAPQTIGLKERELWHAYY